MACIWSFTLRTLNLCLGGRIRRELCVEGCRCGRMARDCEENKIMDVVEEGQRIHLILLSHRQPQQVFIAHVHKLLSGLQARICYISRD